MINTVNMYNIKKLDLDAEKPMISVIIPSYNYGGLIGRCISSILSQTYNNLEIIIVDNYSSDETIQVISEFKDDRIKLIQIHNNGCIAKSRNEGIKHANGKYIAFCDADDWWTPDKLEECIKFLNCHDMVYHKLRIQNSKGNRSKVVGRAPSLSISKDILLNGNFINQSSVVVSKEWINKIGYIDEDINIIGVEDCDTWIRLDLSGCKIGYINKVLGFLWVSNSFSVSQKQIQKESSLLEKHRHSLTSIEYKRAEKTLSLRKGRIYHILGEFSKSKREYRKSFDIFDIKRSGKIIMLFLLASIKYKR